MFVQSFNHYSWSFSILIRTEKELLSEYQNTEEGWNLDSFSESGLF